MIKNDFKNTGVKNRLAVFDLDNTLFNGRFILKAAEEIGFAADLNRVMSETPDPVKRAETIAMMFKGISREKILNITDSISLTDGACEVIEILKQRGYITGIITDSYDLVANLVKEKIMADFSIGIILKFETGAATGKIEIPSEYFISSDSQCKHNYCKGHAFTNYAKNNYINLENSIAVGDGENDLCMIKASGTGIAFCSKSDLLNSAAKVKISEKNLLRILDIIR